MIDRLIYRAVFDAVKEHAAYRIFRATGDADETARSVLVEAEASLSPEAWLAFRGVVERAVTAAIQDVDTPISVGEVP